MRRIIKRALVFFTLVYVFFCAIVYFYPLPFFYNPAKVRSDLSNARLYGYEAEEVHYASADGTPLMAWYTKPRDNKKTVVFMHGNSYNIEEFYHKMKSLADAGYGTFMPEYRGFGGLKGKITQANLEADAIAAVNYLHQQGYKNEDIYVYGMSLGSHMATNTVYQLQNEGRFAGLILEVPFDSLLNVTKMVVPIPLPFELVVKDKYDNLSMIGDIKSPLLVMGGTIDPTVPVVLAQNLYEHAGSPKKMIIYKNGKHSNLYNFRNDLDVLKWLEDNEKGLR